MHHVRDPIAGRRGCRWRMRERGGGGARMSEGLVRHSPCSIGRRRRRRRLRRQRGYCTRPPDFFCRSAPVRLTFYNLILLLLYLYYAVCTIIYLLNSRFVPRFVYIIIIIIIIIRCSRVRLVFILIVPGGRAPVLQFLSPGWRCVFPSRPTTSSPHAQRLLALYNMYAYKINIIIYTYTCIEKYDIK